MVTSIIFYKQCGKVHDIECTIEERRTTYPLQQQLPNLAALYALISHEKNPPKITRLFGSKLYYLGSESHWGDQSDNIQ